MDCLKNGFIILVLGLYSTLSEARFEWRSNEVDCIDQTSIFSKFDYSNNSRDIEIIVPTHLEPTSDGCWLVAYPTRELHPGESTSVVLKCALLHQHSAAYFHKTTPITIRRVNIKNKTELTFTEQLNSSGKLSKKCNPTKQQDVFNEPKTTKDQCPDFRMDQPGQPLGKVPVKFQSYTGACYAATATTLFDYMRAADGKSVADPASMLSSALDYKTHLDSNPVKGADILDNGVHDQLLDFLITDGACTQASVSKNLKLGTLSENQMNALYAVLTYRLKQFTDEIKSRDKPDLKAINQCVRNFRSGLTDDFAWINQYFDPNESEGCHTKGWVNQLDSMLSINPELACLSTATLKDKIPLSCDDKDRVHVSTDWKLEHRSFTDPAFAGTERKFLDQVFFKATQKHPVQLAFLGCLLTKFDPSLPLKEVYASKECQSSGHSAILVGQHWNATKNRCEAILRNSQSITSCSDYSGWDCDLERGTVNVDKDVLLIMTQTAVAIRKKP